MYTVSLHFFLIFRHFFSCSSSFALPYKFQNYLGYIYKKFAQSLSTIVLNLSINLGQIDIFAMLSVPINEHSMSLHLFRSLMSFISILQFSAHKDHTCFIRFTCKHGITFCFKPIFYEYVYHKHFPNCYFPHYF